jgi:hypothetical protein
MGTRLVRTRPSHVRTLNGIYGLKPWNLGTRRIVASKGGQALGVQVSKPGDAPKPSNKMTREEAERLRALLQSTKPADLNDATVRQRVGRAIAWAIERGPSTLNSRATKKD